MNGINHQYIGIRRDTDEVFLDAFGQEQRRSVSIATKNRAGELYIQIPAGTVIGKYIGDGLHYPLGYAELDADMGGAGNTFDVGSDDYGSLVRQFRVGDYLELPESVATGADRFRQITDLDETNDTITVDGGTFDLNAGAAVEVDPTRSFDTVQDAGSTTSDTVTVNDASRFAKGMVVDIGPATATLTGSIPDGTYTGAIGVTINIVDENGDDLLTIDAQMQANSDTDDTIASELATQIDEKLSNYDDGNLGSASSSAGSPSTFTMTLADERHEFTYTHVDSDISADMTFTEDDSTAAEITGVDTGANELTLAKTLTFSNGELVASERNGEYKIVEVTETTSELTYTPQNMLIKTRPRGEVRTASVDGLTPSARAVLETKLEFSNAT